MCDSRREEVIREQREEIRKEEILRKKKEAIKKLKDINHPMVNLESYGNGFDYGVDVCLRVCDKQQDTGSLRGMLDKIRQEVCLSTQMPPVCRFPHIKLSDTRDSVLYTRCRFCKIVERVLLEGGEGNGG